MVFPVPTAAGQTHTDATLGSFTSVELVTGVYVWDKEVEGAEKIWETIDDTTTELTNECYQVGALTAPLAPTVNLNDNETLRIWDANGITATYPLTILPSGTNLIYKNPSTGLDFSGPDPDGLVLDDPSIFNDIEIVKNTNGSYTVDFDPQIVGTVTPITVKPIQTTGFTAEASTQTINYYPIDVSGQASTSNINVVLPRVEQGATIRFKDLYAATTLTRTITLLPNSGIGDTFDHEAIGSYIVMNGPDDAVGIELVGVTASPSGLWAMTSTRNL